jgi:hypothetical protein
MGLAFYFNPSVVELSFSFIGLLVTRKKNETLNPITQKITRATYRRGFEEVNGAILLRESPKAFVASSCNARAVLAE